MPAPSSATFDRLAALVAIDDSASRTTKPVIEVFTGKQLTTIPVSITDDVVCGDGAS